MNLYLTYFDHIFPIFCLFWQPSAGDHFDIMNYRSLLFAYSVFCPIFAIVLLFYFSHMDTFPFHEPIHHLISYLPSFAYFFPMLFPTFKFSISDPGNKKRIKNSGKWLNFLVIIFQNMVYCIVCPFRILLKNGRKKIFEGYCNLSADCFYRKKRGKLVKKHNAQFSSQKNFSSPWTTYCKLGFHTEKCL